MHITRAITLLVGYTFFCVTTVRPHEMLSNPTLEPNAAGEAPKSWRYQDWGTDSRPLYNPTGGRDGSPAAAIECDTTKDRGCWMQRVALEGRRHLHVSAYYRTEGISGSRAAKIRVKWGDAKGRSLPGTSLWLEPAAEWTYFEEIVTAPEGAAFVAPELFNRFGVGRVWWDRANLREATPEDLLRFDDTPARAGEWGFRPADGEHPAVNPPSFVWRPQRAAVAYELQVAADATFEQIVWQTRVERYSAHRPPTPFQPGNYWWRVRSVDDENRTSAWSGIRMVAIPEHAAEFPMPAREELMARIPAGHPRLFLRPTDLPWLRELAGGPLKDRYQELVAQGARFLASPPPTEDYQKYPEGMKRLSPEWARIWRGARSYVARPLNGIATLALVWHLGGPEEYGQAARGMLMDIAEWDPLGATGYRYNDEAGMRYAWGFSRAYTLTHALLTEAERETCRNVMQVRGREMYGHLHTQRQHLWNPYSSHPNRAYHWLGEIGLAFHGEIPEAEEWAWFATNIFFHVYPVWSDPDGGWHEGVHYWHGYISRVTQWLDIMRATLDIDGYRKPFFSQAGYLPIYAQPPNAPRTTFGDTTGVRRPKNVRPVMTQFVRQTGNPYWADYLERIGGPTDGRTWLDFVRAARAHDRAPIERRSVAELPSSRLFEGTGIAYLHTDLTDARQNVQVSFKSSPFGSWSHGNEAQNSFELHAYGDALLVRSGTREIHGSPHHRNWTWQTHSTNAITVNDTGQIAHTPDAAGRITAFAGGESCDYVVGDASQACPPGLVTRAHRHMLFVKPDLVIVYDDLEAPDPATFQYYLHSPYAFEPEAGQRLEITGENATCRIDLVAPRGLRVTCFEGYDPPIRPPFDKKIREYHLKAETIVPSHRGEFIAILNVTRVTGESAGLAQHEKHPSGHALRLDMPQGEVVVLFRTDEPDLSAWGLSTDGRVAAVRLDDDGKPVDFFVSGNAQVRWRNAVLPADR